MSNVGPLHPDNLRPVINPVACARLPVSQDRLLELWRESGGAAGCGNVFLPASRLAAFVEKLLDEVTPAAAAVVREAVLELEASGWIHQRSYDAGYQKGVFDAARGGPAA